MAQAVSPTQILLSGKAPGETSLIIWDQSGGRQFFNVTVRPSTFASNDVLDGIRRELRAELPGQNVRVSQDNGVIFLRGTVSNLNNSDRAVMIASTAGKVVNLLNVNVPAAEPQILLKVRFASIDRTKEKQLGSTSSVPGSETRLARSRPISTRRRSRQLVQGVLLQLLVVSRR